MRRIRIYWYNVSNVFLLLYFSGYNSIQDKYFIFYFFCYFPGLQVPAGHHRHPGYGRVVRGGQAQGGQSQEDREVPLATLPG